MFEGILKNLGKKNNFVVSLEPKGEQKQTTEYDWSGLIAPAIGLIVVGAIIFAETKAPAISVNNLTINVNLKGGCKLWEL